MQLLDVLQVCSLCSPHAYSYELCRANLTTPTQVPHTHSHSELRAQTKRATRGNAKDVVDWVLAPGCRRRKLLQYMGEARQGGCDANQNEVLCDWCRDRNHVQTLLRGMDRAVEQHLSFAERVAQQMGGEGWDRKGDDEGDQDEKCKDHCKTTVLPSWVCVWGWWSTYAHTNHALTYT